LKQLLVDGHLLTGDDCTDVIDSLKGVQTPVEVPTPAGMAGYAFVETLTQNGEGVISATKGVLPIPKPAVADVGKMLQVNASGGYELVTIVNSELQPY
jgi:uncharacterized protein (DUF111 family)